MVAAIKIRQLYKLDEPARRCTTHWKYRRFQQHDVSHCELFRVKVLPWIAYGIRACTYACV